MKPDQPDPAEIPQRVRQQLILAQVRIMDLEDARDAATGRLTEIERLLSAAQALADQKLDEAAHVEKVRADLQVQFEHLRSLHVVATGALDAARARLDAATAGAAAHQLRVAELETDLRNLRASRSWRWTAWLRALGGNPP